MASKVSYSINLSRYFDNAFSSKGRDVQDQLRPLIFNDAVKSRIARDVIDRIIFRTETERIDKNGTPMVGYSKAYAESLEGKIKGAKQGQSANLVFTKQMLSNMVNAPAGNDEVRIEFLSQLQNDKAHGHINGSKILPQRDFLGLPDSEITEIVRDVINESSGQNVIGLIDLAGDIQAGLSVGPQTTVVSTGVVVNLEDEFNAN